MRKILFFVMFLLVLVSCNFSFNNNKDKSNQGLPPSNSVNVSFFNESAYRVELYHNVNPQQYTSIEPNLVLEPAETKTLQMPKSIETSFGETFYLRYYIQLPGSENAEKPVFVSARANNKMENIQFVTSEDKTITIPHPKKGELVFMQAILKVQNKCERPINVLTGVKFLDDLGRGKKGLSLDFGETGFYELKFSETTKLLSSDDFTEEVSGIRFEQAENPDKIVNISPFTIKPGYVYSFEWDGKSATVQEPTVSAIQY